MMINLRQFILFACLLILMVEGCMLDISSDSSSDSFTESDLLAARQIIGSSLSTDNSGIVLSINDAVNIISRTSSSNNTVPKMLLKDRSGNEFNYQSEFDPNTGIFNVSFQRESQNPLFQKTVSNKLTYLYKNDTSQIIENPEAQSNNIASVNFTAIKNGQLKTLSKTSTFKNRDTLFIAGYGNSEVSVEGTESASGKIQIEQPGGKIIKHSYNLQLSILDLAFEKPAMRDSSGISLAVKGNASFKLMFNRQKSSTPINGTLKINGDGTALLRFQNSSEKYLVNLKTGDTKNLNNAFLGGVASLDVNQQKITLANGITIFVNDSTTFLNLKYRSLKAVSEKLKENIPILTNGTGIIKNNKFNADQISFSEGRLDDINQNEIIVFNEFVSAVQQQGKRITLNEQVELQLLDNTPISDFGDYNSLQEVAAGLSNGELIKIKGKAFQSAAGLLRVVQGTAITFKRYQQSN